MEKNKNIRTYCDLCNSSFENFRKLFIKNNFTIVKCKTCGLVFTLEVPTNENLKEFYDRNYYEGKVYESYSKEEQDRKRSYTQILITVEKFLNSHNMNFLEIGCATGTFLDCSKFFGYDIVGIEKSEYSAGISRSKGFSVYTDDIDILFKNGIIKEKSFDAVFMWDVVEHLINPCLTIKNSNYVTKIGGLIILNTLNISSPTVKYLKKEWSHFFPPYHLFYYNIRTLKQLLQQNGYSILKLKTNGPLLYDDIKDKYYLFKRLASNNFIGKITNKFKLGYAQYIIARKIKDMHIE